MTAITINGALFDVPDDPSIVPGVPLTENMASALQRARRENVRNNMSRKVDEVRNGADSLTDQQYAELQEQVRQFAERFQFGARQRSVHVSDPVEREARNDVGETIKATYLAQHGLKLRNSEIGEAIDEVMASPKGNEYRNRARQRLQEREADANALQSVISKLEPPQREAA